MEEPSINELLRRAGFGHRRYDENFPSTHEIFRLDTGEVVGHCTALAAYERFCKESDQ